MIFIWTMHNGHDFVISAWLFKRRLSSVWKLHPVSQYRSVSNPEHNWGLRVEPRGKNVFRVNPFHKIRNLERMLLVLGSTRSTFWIHWVRFGSAQTEFETSGLKLTSHWLALSLMHGRLKTSEDVRWCLNRVGVQQLTVDSRCLGDEAWLTSFAYVS